MLKGALGVVIAVMSAAGYADETTAVDLPQAATTLLIFRAFDPNHLLTRESAMLGAIAGEMTAMTRWPVRQKQETSNTVAETGSRTRFDAQQHSLVIEYIALSRYLNGGYTGSTLSIPIAYAVERVDDNVKISLSFPQQASLERKGMPFLTRKLWDMNQITDDYASVVGRLQTVELHFHYWAKGEMESKYRPEAVLGNLQRILGRPERNVFQNNRADQANSISRDEVFVSRVDGKYREVRVSVLPYHDGSKVNYASELPYTLKSDGSVVGDDTSRSLNEQLSKIVND